MDCVWLAPFGKGLGHTGIHYAGELVPEHFSQEKQAAGSAIDRAARVR